MSNHKRKDQHRKIDEAALAGQGDQSSRPSGMQAYLNGDYADKEAQDRLATMEASLVYDEKVMGTRCNR